MAAAEPSQITDVLLYKWDVPPDLVRKIITTTNTLAVPENFHEDLDFFRSGWTTGTCEWIRFNPSYIDWTSDSKDGPTMLWLHALPASGKSFLTSYITHQLLEDSFFVYHFFRFGNESKSTASACMRSIVFQIAKQFPAFRRALKKYPIHRKDAGEGGCENNLEQNLCSTSVQNEIRNNHLLGYRWTR